MSRHYATLDELRADRPDVTEKHLDRERAELEHTELAYKLAQIRKTAGLTQNDVAASMGVSQVRVSEIERGSISRTEVDTVARYVHALGGRLMLVAELGDTAITIDTNVAAEDSVLHGT